MARTVSLKFSLEEADRFLKGLEGMGKAGEDMAARLDKAAKKAESSGQGFKKTQSAVDSLNSSFQSMAGRVPVIGGLLQGLGPIGTAAAVGIGAIGASLAFAFSKAREAAVAFDALGESAKRVGVGVETLQELRVAATLSGVGIDALDNALAKLVRNQDKANQGSKELIQQFARVGITLDELRTLSPDELFRQMADGVAGLGTQAEKIGASEGLFGRGGSKLIETLDGGSAAIDRMAERARELGLVVGANVVSDMGKLNDEIDIMQQAIDINLKTAFSGFAPVLLDVAELAASLALGFREFIAQFRDIENLGKFDLQSRQKSLREEIAGLEKLTTGPFTAKGNRGIGLTANLEKLAELDNELIKVEARLKELSKLEKPLVRIVDEDSPAQIKNTEDAAKKAADESKKRGDALRKQWDDELDYLLKSAQHNSELRKKDAERAALMPDFLRGLEREVELAGMSADERRIALEIDKARDLLGLKINDTLDKGVEAQIRAKIEQLNGIEAAKKAAEDSAREWEKFTDQIKESLTDSIVRGFEEGESAGKIFFDSLRRAALTAAIKIPVDFVVDAGAGLLRGAIGGAAGSAGGSLLTSIGGSLLGKTAIGRGVESGIINFGLNNGLFSVGTGQAIAGALPVVGLLAGLAGLSGVFKKKNGPPNAGGQLIESGGVFSVGPTGADNGGDTAGVIEQLSAAAQALNTLAQGLGIAQSGSGLASFIDTFGAGGIRNANDLVKDAVSKGVIEGLTGAQKGLIAGSEDPLDAIRQVIEQNAFPAEIADMLLQKTDPRAFATKILDAEIEGYRLRAQAANDNGVTLANVEKLYQIEVRKIEESFASGAGAAISAALENALRAQSIAAGRVDAALRVVEKSVGAERDLVTASFNARLKESRAALDDVTRSIQRIQGVANSLRSALGGLDTPGQEGAARLQAQLQLRGFLAGARSGAGLPDQQALDEVLRVLQKPSEGLFNTFLDYQRDFITTKNDIGSLAEIAEREQRGATGQSALLQAQIDLDQRAYDNEIARLDGILTGSQAQVDEIRGTTIAVMSVEAAIRALADALGGARTANAAAAAADPVNSLFKGLLGRPVDQAGALHFNADLAGGQSTVDVAQNIIRSPEFASVNRTVEDLYTTIFGASRAPDAEGLAYWKGQLAAGQSLQEIALNFTRGGEYADLVKVRGFAHGGIHPGGLRIVGERGPELEFTGPSRIFSNQQSAAILDNSALVAEIKAMRTELNAALVSIAVSSADTAKRVRKFDGDGLPATRTAA